jgi:hypothetical protein
MEREIALYFLKKTRMIFFAKPPALWRIKRGPLLAINCCHDVPFPEATERFAPRLTS